MHYSTVKPSCLNLRVITENFSGVQIFRIFMVFYTDIYRMKADDKVIKSYLKKSKVLKVFILPLSLDVRRTLKIFVMLWAF